jgi:putative hydrolase of the HAD superfamily
MIKAVFFDFDGVLTTNSSATTFACAQLAERTGLEYDRLLSCYWDQGADLLLGRKSFADIWPAFCKCVGQDIDIALLRPIFKATPMNAPMFELAKRIRSNEVKIGIITDNDKERFDTLIELFHLRALFDCLIVSSETGKMKDEPEPFEQALSRMHIKPEEMVFIDNQEKNLEIPSKMGIHTLFYDDERNDISALIRELVGLGIQA